MGGVLRPRLDILPPSQRRLWPELATLPPGFVLYGGTAVALHLGHRESVDFDLFTAAEIDPRRLLDDLSILSGAVVTQMEPNTLSVTVDRGGPIKLSFFGVPRLGRVRPPMLAEDIGLPVAHLLDLGGTKASVVQVRAEPKDYIDIDALIGAGVSLPEMLSAGRVLYGHTFSAQSALKAVAWFADPGLAGLPVDLRHRLSAAVRAVDLDALPELDPLSPRASGG